MVIAYSICLAYVFVGQHDAAEILDGALASFIAALVVTFLSKRLHQPTGEVLRFAHILHLV